MMIFCRPRCTFCFFLFFCITRNVMNANDRPISETSSILVFSRAIIVILYSYNTTSRITRMQLLLL